MQFLPQIDPIQYNTIESNPIHGWIQSVSNSGQNSNLYGKYSILLILCHRRTIFKMLALEQSAEKWSLSAGGGVVLPLRPPPPSPGRGSFYRSDPLPPVRGGGRLTAPTPSPQWLRSVLLKRTLTVCTSMAPLLLLFTILRQRIYYCISTLTH